MIPVPWGVGMAVVGMLLGDLFEEVIDRAAGAGERERGVLCGAVPGYRRRWPARGRRRSR